MYIIGILEEDSSGCHRGWVRVRSPKEFWSFLHLAARCMLFLLTTVWNTGERASVKSRMTMGVKYRWADFVLSVSCPKIRVWGQRKI